MLVLVDMVKKDRINREKNRSIKKITKNEIVEILAKPESQNLLKFKILIL